MFNDAFKEKKDGSNHITGTMLNKLDRGTYYLIVTAGGTAYILYKNKEFKHELPVA